MRGSFLRRFATATVANDNLTLGRALKSTRQTVRDQARGLKTLGELARIHQSRARTAEAERDEARRLRDERTKAIDGLTQDRDRYRELELAALRDRDGYAAKLKVAEDELDVHCRETLKLQDERDALTGIVEQMQGTAAGKLAVENARLRANLNDLEERIASLRLANEQAHKELAEARAAVRHA